MPKLEKETLFIVLKNGYDFAFRFYADWETEKSFGSRGVTTDRIRYTGSTGEMYSKDDCKWIKPIDKKQEEKIINEMDKSREIINTYKAKIRLEREKMQKYFDNIKKNND